MPVTEKDLESFNPRTAALFHASEAKDWIGVATSIACGLVYVGDQLRRANLMTEFDVLYKRAKDGTRTKVTKRLMELDAQLWPNEKGGDNEAR